MNKYRILNSDTGEQYVSIKDLKIILYEIALSAENVQRFHIKQVINLLEEIEGTKKITLKAI